MSQLNTKNNSQQDPNLSFRLNQNQESEEQNCFEILMQKDREIESLNEKILDLEYLVQQTSEQLSKATEKCLNYKKKLNQMNYSFSSAISSSQEEDEDDQAGSYNEIEIKNSKNKLKKSSQPKQLKDGQVMPDSKHLQISEQQQQQIQKEVELRYLQQLSELKQQLEESTKTIESAELIVNNLKSENDLCYKQIAEFQDKKKKYKELKSKQGVLSALNEKLTIENESFSKEIQQLKNNLINLQNEKTDLVKHNTLSQNQAIELLKSQLLANTQQSAQDKLKLVEADNQLNQLSNFLKSAKQEIEEKNAALSQLQTKLREQDQYYKDEVQALKNQTQKAINYLNSSRKNNEQNNPPLNSPINQPQNIQASASLSQRFANLTLVNQANNTQQSLQTHNLLVRRSSSLRKTLTSNNIQQQVNTLDNLQQTLQTPFSNADCQQFQDTQQQYLQMNANDSKEQQLQVTNFADNIKVYQLAPDKFLSYEGPSIKDLNALHLLQSNILLDELDKYYDRDLFIRLIIEKFCLLNECFFQAKKNQIQQYEISMKTHVQQQEDGINQLQKQIAQQAEQLMQLKANNEYLSNMNGILQQEVADAVTVAQKLMKYLNTISADYNQEIVLRDQYFCAVYQSSSDIMQTQMTIQQECVQSKAQQSKLQLEIQQMQQEIKKIIEIISHSLISREGSLNNSCTRIICNGGQADINSSFSQQDALITECSSSASSFKRKQFLQVNSQILKTLMSQVKSLCREIERLQLENKEYNDERARLLKTVEELDQNFRQAREKNQSLIQDLTTKHQQEEQFMRLQEEHRELQYQMQTLISNKQELEMQLKVAQDAAIKLQKQKEELIGQLDMNQQKLNNNESLLINKIKILEQEIIDMRKSLSMKPSVSSCEPIKDKINLELSQNISHGAKLKENQQNKCNQIQINEYLPVAQGIFNDEKDLQLSQQEKLFIKNNPQLQSIIERYKQKAKNQFAKRVKELEQILKYILEKTKGFNFEKNGYLLNCPHHQGKSSKNRIITSEIQLSEEAANANIYKNLKQIIANNPNIEHFLKEINQIIEFLYIDSYNAKNCLGHLLLNLLNDLQKLDSDNVGRGSEDASGIIFQCQSLLQKIQQASFEDNPTKDFSMLPIVLAEQDRNELKKSDAGYIVGKIISQQRKVVDLIHFRLDLLINQQLIQQSSKSIQQFMNISNNKTKLQTQYKKIEDPNQQQINYNLQKSCNINQKQLLNSQKNYEME